MNRVMKSKPTTTLPSTGSHLLGYQSAGRAFFAGGASWSASYSARSAGLSFALNDSKPDIADVAAMRRSHKRIHLGAELRFATSP